MTLDKMNRMNEILSGILKVAYLNFLWTIFTILGLGVFSIGPATYAMIKCYDRWLRFGESIPVAKSFWQFFKERYWQSAIVSWLYLIVGIILVSNIFFNRLWSIQMVNVLMLILVLFSLTHIYTIMVATTYQKLGAIFKGAFLLGFGYLHYTLIIWTSLGVFYYLTASFAPGFLFVFGIGLMGFAFSLGGKIILKDFQPT